MSNKISSKFKTLFRGVSKANFSIQTEWNQKFLSNFKKSGRINRIFITGCNGQIGMELYPYLKAIYGEDNLLLTDMRPPKQELKNFKELNITDKAQVNKLIHNFKPDYIMNFAAILSASGEKNIKLCQDVNINGFMNILEAATELKAGVFSPSTIAAFGPSTPRLCTPNLVVMRPTTVYGISKIHNELMGTYYSRRFNIDFRSIRYPQVISPTPPGGGSGDYAIEIFYEALKSKEYTCYLHENSRIPMIYINDLIQGTLNFIEHDSKTLSETVYNIEGCNFTPKEIAGCIKSRIPDFKMDYKIDFRQQIVDTWPESLDDTLARKDWNWKPQYDILKLTEIMIELLKNQK